LSDGVTPVPMEGRPRPTSARSAVVGCALLLVESESEAQPVPEAEEAEREAVEEKGVVAEKGVTEEEEAVE